MQVESYKVNIIAIAAFVEQVGFQKISHDTMPNQRNTVQILLIRTPVKLRQNRNFRGRELSECCIQIIKTSDEIVIET